MSRGLTIAIISFAACGVALAQGPSQPHHYMLHPTIEHHAGTATVKADYADPLGDALAAVSKEYGWLVDYEDPPYAGTDITPVPSRGPGVPADQVVAGGAFQSTYTETPNMWSSRDAELDVLEKIVSDYNASGNPGDFTVRTLSDGNYDVVGVSTRDSSGAQVAVKPILDTPISVPSIPRSRAGTFGAILAALPVKVLYWGRGGDCGGCARSRRHDHVWEFRSSSGPPDAAGRTGRDVDPGVPAPAYGARVHFRDPPRRAGGAQLVRPEAADSCRARTVNRRLGSAGYPGGARRRR